MYKVKYVVFLLISAIPIVAYFCDFNLGVFNSTSDWANFGSYVGGVYGALGFIAVVFTLYTNGQQALKSEQDQVFYKSMELFLNRTNSYEAHNYKGAQAVEAIVGDIQKEFRSQCIKNARNILCSRPNEISCTHYTKIVDAHCNGNYDKNINEFILKKIKEAVSEDKTEQKRWEEIKYYIGSQGQESDLMKEALYALGSVWFYKIPFEERQSMYKSVVQEINFTYSGFIDSYVRNLEFLAAFIHKSKNKDLYVKFIKSQLSNYEMVVIYHFAMGSENSDIYKVIVELELLDVTSIETRAMMVDLPSYDEIRNDLDNLKAS
ncbi:putative phage abortive infection protein [Vibrio chagasii]|uniref:putative phage abortive infection protein n=1 Tax=Vibrio chagasii TaxID=170679 RepID=UPI003BB5FE5C